MNTIPHEARNVWAPLICLVFQELLNLNDERFALHAAEHYYIITEMIGLSYDGSLNQIAFFIGKFFWRSRG